ncbi:MAG: cupin domain-containing protein [Chitinophagales bacterium]
MKQIFRPAIMALAVSFFFVACNNEEKKTEPANTDSTQSSTTMTDTTSQKQDMDAAKVAPALYKVAKDSMGIRVLNIEYKPGDSSAMHSHPDVVLYVIDGGKGEFTGKDGSKNVVDLKPGMVLIQGSTMHSVKNVGTTTLKAILVEVNRPNTAAATPNPKMDAAKVASSLYKVVADSMNIRVLMATYKPGASSAMHSHPDNVIYVINGTKAEFTGKDGSKQTMMMDDGMTAIMPAATHSVKNIGSKTTKVLVVEINRPGK